MTELARPADPVVQRDHDRSRRPRGSASTGADAVRVTLTAARLAAEMSAAGQPSHELGAARLVATFAPITGSPMTARPSDDVDSLVRVSRRTHAHCDDAQHKRSPRVRTPDDAQHR